MGETQHPWRRTHRYFRLLAQFQSEWRIVDEPRDRGANRRNFGTQLRTGGGRRRVIRIMRGPCKLVRERLDGTTSFSELVRQRLNPGLGKPQPHSAIHDSGR
jgi:hypothetical protein